jgi:hypothetical protein
VLFEEASETYKLLYSEKSEKYIITIHNLATLHRDMKNHEKSLELYETLKQIVDSDEKLVQPNTMANIYLTAAGK